MLSFVTSYSILICKSKLFLVFKSLTELSITNTDPKLWTKAPTTGFNIPVIAKIIAKKFKASENVTMNYLVMFLSLIYRK